MCGIAGLFLHRIQVPDARHAALAMGQRLKHRGPDASGVFADEQVALAHQRLSIIDTEGSQQPFVDPESGCVLVYNGEIYNYRALRTELEAKGVRFQSDGDTEVLLKLLLCEGPSGLKAIRGMFAFAFYDPRDQSLTLARDTFGKKPLFYCWSAQGAFAFASEPSAFLTLDWFKPEMSPEAAACQIAMAYLPGDEWLWKGVHRLEPGTWMKLRPDGSRVSGTHVTLDDLGRASPPQTYQEAREEFSRLFAQSVQRRLVADVPRVVWLSAGLDSNAIALEAASQTQEAISLRCEGFELDETQEAESAAQSYQIPFHRATLRDNEVSATFEQWMETALDPLGDGGLLPFFALARETRARGYKLALAGDGGDELMFGYQTFQAASIARRLGWLPQSFWQRLASALECLPEGEGYFGWSFKVKRMLRGMAVRAGERNTYWMATESQSRLTSFMPRELRDAMTHALDRSAAIGNQAHKAEPDDPLRALRYELLRSYLRDDILVKTDRASMANGVEARAPFLDVDLADFILSLPTQWLFWRGKGKRILKDCYEQRLPREIVERKKTGFSIPYHRWGGGSAGRAEFALMAFERWKSRVDSGRQPSDS